MAGTTNRIANQGVYISSGFSTMNDTSLLLSGQLGQVVVQGEKVYQLVQFESGIIAVVATTPVLWKSPSSFIVTDDYDATGANRNQPAGVALTTMTASSYGWIQVFGPGTVYTKTAEAASAGDSLVYDGADSQVIKVAAGTAPTYAPVAIATGSQSANATACYIVCPHNGW